MKSTDLKRRESDFLRRLPDMMDDDFMIVVRESYQPECNEIYSLPKVNVAIEREIFVRIRNTAETFAVLMSAASQLLTRHSQENTTHATSEKTDG